MALTCIPLIYVMLTRQRITRQCNVLSVMHVITPFILMSTTCKNKSLVIILDSSRL